MKPASPDAATKTVSGRAMLLVTLLLVSALVALAGPFGRELTIRQQPQTHWTAADRR